MDSKSQGRKISKNGIIGLSVSLSIIIVAAAIVCAVLLTRPVANVSTPTPTPTVTSSTLPTSNILLKNDAGLCYEFGNIVTPNVLLVNACTLGAYWTYDPNLLILSFIGQNFQTCMQAPTATTFPVLGGNINCRGVTLSNHFIETTTQCIQNNSGTLEWHTCVTPFSFEVIPVS